MKIRPWMNGNVYCYCVQYQEGQTEEQAVIKALALFAIRALSISLSAQGFPVATELKPKMIEKDIFFPPKEGNKVVSSFIYCDSRRTLPDAYCDLEITYLGRNCGRSRGHKFSYALLDKKNTGDICVETIQPSQVVVLPSPQGLH
jgi:hypothetical protein